MIVDDIGNQLQDIGHSPPSNLAELISSTDVSVPFANLIYDLCQEVQKFVSMDESVSRLEDNGSTVEHVNNWKLELSSFLNELRCPNECLVQGDLDKRLSGQTGKLLLLDYLIGEILSMRLQRSNDLGKDRVLLNQAVAALDLQMRVSFDQLVSTVAKVKTDALVGKAIFPFLNELGPDSLAKLEELSASLQAEYTLRRTMLITRLSATLQSFSWSDRMKHQMPPDICEAIAMRNLEAVSSVSLPDLLVARTDLLAIGKVSSKPPDARSNHPLTKVKVGRVPDRGGRPSEQAAPPPEMPSWQQRSGQVHDSRGFRGGRGGGGSHHGGGGGYDKNRGVQGAGWKRSRY